MSENNNDDNVLYLKRRSPAEPEQPEPTEAEHWEEGNESLGGQGVCDADDQAR